MDVFYFNYTILWNFTYRKVLNKLSNLLLFYYEPNIDLKSNAMGETDVNCLFKILMQFFKYF